MTLPDLFWASVVASLLLLAGTVLSRRVGLLQRLFLPGSILGGCLALALGPQGLGAAGLPILPERYYEIWRGFPGLLITVVFAALFLGVRVPGLREIWRKAGPQVAYGQTLAWGQYVVGLGLAVLVLGPVFGMPPIAGALIEIGFEGGHGTSAGMADTFRELGFPEGADLALALATVGLVSGIVIGTVLIQWAVRRGWIDPGRTPVDSPARPLPASRSVSASSEPSSTTDPLAVHLGIVGLAIGVGWLLQNALLWIERHTWGGADGLEVFRFVPLFPLAMIGGLLVQVGADRLGYAHRIQRRHMARIAGTALDWTIVSALATLSLRVIRTHWMPFLILALGGLVWTVATLLILAPRVLPDNWFVRGIGDFGQSTGVTVTGLLLIRMADPYNRSGALESFGYKQLLFEPIVGGGLFTAASPALIVRFGPGPVLVFTAFVTLFWVAFGLAAFGRHRWRN